MQIQGLRFQAKSVNRFKSQDGYYARRKDRYDVHMSDSYKEAVDRRTNKGGIVFDSGTVWWLTNRGWEDANPGSREEQEARQIVLDAFS